MLLVAIVPVLSLQVFLRASLTHQTPTFVQPSGQQQLELTGRGRQMFSCVDDAWEAEGGDAQLYSADGRNVGHHYPEDHKVVFNLDNGNKIIATKTGSEASPNGASNAPWLSLNVISGPYKSITRTFTSGGVPPSQTCQTGEQANSDYSAEYTFY
ncbi:hypothetical protein PCANC_14320 [Puccinia coronata f. sp. avenae]|uniref:Uncharacterized protein n=1 Tax=Puccinia coronata f. sp. avenae TaxID=200324 RepID=A0A2N5VLC8_9BASI|nr:hypothetical protein PCANC_14320 [Puccinia coronata f. sp. avenae]